MPPRSRRALLSALGALAGGLAGCSSPSETPTSRSTVASTPTRTPTSSPSPTETESPTPTDPPTPAERGAPCQQRWNPTDRWRFTTGSRASRPVVVDGTLYFATPGSLDDDVSYVYALDAASGAVRWRRQQRVRLYGTAAVDAGTVVFPSYDAIEAYDAATGERRWRYAPPQEQGQVQTDSVVADGRVFVAARTVWGTEEEPAENPYHRLYGIDLDGGEPAVEVELSMDDGSEGIAAADGTVYVSTGEGRLLSFDAATGERRWTRELLRRDANPVLYAPVVARDSVYLDVDGTLVAVDAADGTVRWRHDGGFHDDPAVGDAPVYCATRAELFAFEPSSGRPRWRADLEGTDVGRLSATDDAVYLSAEIDDRGAKVAFDAETGCRRGTYPVSARNATRAAVADGTVYFGGVNREGAVYAVSRPPSGNGR